MKVARGRSWQPEIGMEHASRGRRSGNKGVGARWRGRFRIFSARHCSRTKVSHAENSGMTMLFFSLAVAPMSEGDFFTCSGAAARGVRGLGDFFTRSGVDGTRGLVFRATCRLRRGRHEGVGFCFFLEGCSRCPPERHGDEEVLVWGIFLHALLRRDGAETPQILRLSCFSAGGRYFAGGWGRARI